MTPPSPPSFWNIPNLLSLSRIPLAVVLCAGISLEYWLFSLVVYTIAALTDWLDGWWARRFQLVSPIGRSLDPLTDKVLVCAAFIYLATLPKTGVFPWMVSIIVGRELLITGLRGIVEATGANFGADWFGKLKTILQMVALFGVFLVQWLGTVPEAQPYLHWLRQIYLVILYAAVFATLGSGVQYLVKALRVLR